MPKIKSHSGAKKRFKITKLGKIKRKKTMARHKLTKKGPDRMRNLRKSGTLEGADADRIKKMIPYA